MQTFMQRQQKRDRQERCLRQTRQTAARGTVVVIVAAENVQTAEFESLPEMSRSYFSLNSALELAAYCLRVAPVRPLINILCSDQ